MSRCNLCASPLRESLERERGVCYGCYERPENVTTGWWPDWGKVRRVRV